MPVLESRPVAGEPLQAPVADGRRLVEFVRLRAEGNTPESWAGRRRRCTGSGRWTLEEAWVEWLRTPASVPPRAAGEARPGTPVAPDPIPPAEAALGREPAPGDKAPRL